jgi:hypothetical protein
MYDLGDKTLYKLGKPFKLSWPASDLWEILTLAVKYIIDGVSYTAFSPQ